MLSYAFPSSYSLLSSGVILYTLMTSVIACVLILPNLYSQSSSLSYQGHPAYWISSVGCPVHTSNTSQSTLIFSASVLLISVNSTIIHTCCHTWNLVIILIPRFFLHPMDHQDLSILWPVSKNCPLLSNLSTIIGVQALIQFLLDY